MCKQHATGTLRVARSTATGRETGSSSKTRGRTSRVVVAFGAIALLLGCTDTTKPSNSTSPSQQALEAATTTVVAGCEASPYYKSELPAPFARYMNGPVVWMGGPEALAVLFYTEADPARIEIGTHGIQGPGANSKILWLIDGPPDGPMTLLARNRDTGSEVSATVEGAGNYPSIPELPEPGCWDLTASIDGEARLTITIPAIDRQ